MIAILLNIVAEMWNVLGEMAVYLLFGFFVAGVLSVLISPETVERHLGGRGFWPVVKAALVGVPLPLCSCGVIPVAASLRKHGASRGATTSFLISTPQTGVDSILVTYSLLGIVFAVFRPIVAFISGIIGGLLVEALDRTPSSGEMAVTRAARMRAVPWRAGKSMGNFTGFLEHGFVVLPADIAWQLVGGLLVAGLISALVPAHYFSHGFLGSGIGAMLAMMLLGIPTYVCASASVPMAMALLSTGVSPGAVLVFLITGPASNAASIATIWKILGQKTALIYLATIGATAILAGYALDFIFTFKGVPGAMMEMGHMVPGYINTISAAALLGILIVPKIYAWWMTRREFAPDSHQEGVILNITGMTCNECAESVREALLACDGVNEAWINLHTGEARIQGEHPDVEDLRGTVKRLGFGVR